jgi:hypothetical protein
MLRWISALSVTVMLAAACGPPVETEPRSQPPEPEPDELVHPDAVWFDVLQVSPTAPDPSRATGSQAVHIRYREVSRNSVASSASPVAAGAAPRHSWR